MKKSKKKRGRPATQAGPCSRCRRPDRPKKAKSLCGTCYDRDRIRKAPKCKIQGCGGTQASKKLCVKHYKAARRAAAKLEAHRKVS